MSSPIRVGPKARHGAGDIGAGDIGVGAVDDRATSLLVIAILTFRVLFTAAPLPVLLHHGGVTAAPFALGVTSIALSAAMIAYVARGMDLATARFVPLLVADFVLSCAVGLSGSGLPEDAENSLHAVLWFPFHGTVMLWTVLLGAVWGFVSVAVGVGMFTVPFSIEQLGEPDAVTLVLTHTVWLTLPLLVAVVASVLLRMIVRAVLAHGVRMGRSDEQVKMTRTLHDTVLQTLESMAMRPDRDQAAPDERLTELQAAAARQAVELRQLLEMDPACESTSMAGMLAALVRDLAGMGLRVELVMDDFGGREPDAAVQHAMCEAAREALANIVKHAGVHKAVVRAGLTADGVELIVRDRGRGFDMRRRPPGFGIEQSIIARMREVGGDAIVSSRPRRGTRVRLVIPG